jgi:hypothetical protein
MKDQIEQYIPVSSIRVSHNPRKSHRGLLDLWHEKGRADRSEEDRKSFVAHIDEKFPHIRERAVSLQLHGQILPVTLRPYRSGGQGDYLYGIASGECRILAYGLIEAETGVSQKVRAITKQMTVDEAFEQGIVENTERKDMDPLDLAAAYHEMLTVRINPATKPGGSLFRKKHPKGRPYTLQELADRVNKDYHWVRGRAALVYLPEKDQNALLEGKRNLTAMCKIACKLKSAATGEQDEAETEPISVKGVIKKERRRRVVPMPRLVELFDATPHDQVERLQALAEVMGIVSEDGNPVTPAKALKIALAEREERESEKELAEARKVERQREKQSAA